MQPLLFWKDGMTGFTSKWANVQAKAGKGRQRQQDQRDPTISQVHEGGCKAGALTLEAARKKKPFLRRGKQSRGRSVALGREHQGQAQQQQRCRRRRLLHTNFSFYKLRSSLEKIVLLFTKQWHHSNRVELRRHNNPNQSHFWLSYVRLYVTVNSRWIYDVTTIFIPNKTGNNSQERKVGLRINPRFPHYGENLARVC